MSVYYENDLFTIYFADCRDIISNIAYDSVVTDPPYPAISRDYGMWTEKEWHHLMREVTLQIRENIALTGSAVFILQANSERIGRMRSWLWEYMAWAAREWNQIQDVWWWNYTAPPTAHCQKKWGLMRPSVKACVWLGDPSCYKNQDNILWEESDANRAARLQNRWELKKSPSGMSMRGGRAAKSSLTRGGVTPFNLIPFANTNSKTSSGSLGHGAGTSEAVTDWWTRYITPDAGILLDPFCGAGTAGVSAIKRGAKFIGIEKEEKYCEITVKRLLSLSENKK